MKKENMFLVINTVILLLISGLFIVLYSNFVPRDPEDRLFNQMIDLREEETIEEIPNSNVYSIISSKVKAFNRSNEQIAYIYNGNIMNYFGHINILVGITVEDRVFVQIVSFEQTSTYMPGIQNYVFEYFRDVDYLEIKDIPVLNLEDPDAGATASESTGSIKELVLRIVNFHFEVLPTEPTVLDPYEELFGVGFQREHDDTFAPSALVVSKELVKNASNEHVGYIYKAVGTGDYEGYDGTQSGSVTIYIVLDLNGGILMIDVPTETYGHSKGSFLTRILNYATEFEGNNISEIEAIRDEKSDLHTGATGSKTLFDLLVDAVSEVILG